MTNALMMMLLTSVTLWCESLQIPDCWQRTEWQSRWGCWCHWFSSCHLIVCHYSTIFDAKVRVLLESLGFAVYVLQPWLNLPYWQWAQRRLQWVRFAHGLYDRVLRGDLKRWVLRIRLENHDHSPPQCWVDMTSSRQVWHILCLIHHSIRPEKEMEKFRQIETVKKTITNTYQWTIR